MSRWMSLAGVTMLNSHAVFALRTFMRHKAHTLINLLGLTIGMSCTLLMLLYVNYEMSYDGFHVHKNNLYRMNKVSYDHGELNYKSAFTFSAQGPVMKSAIPEIADYVRLLHSEGVVRYFNSQNAPASFREHDIYFADASFFDLFSYHLKQGDVHSVLTNTNSIVLSESAANRYFGTENPIGKIVTYGKDNLMVSGICEDPPTNTHLRFSALVSFSTLKVSDTDSWTDHAFYTYILLRNGTDPKAVEPKLSLVFDKFIEKYWNGSISNIWNLQRVDDIYLYSTDFTSISLEYGDYKTVLYVFMAALLVLTIAWLNFITLLIAQLPERAKEIGIRKAVGASRNQLIAQFVVESLFLNLGAAVVGVTMVQCAVPWLNYFLGLPLSLLRPPQSWLWAAGLLLFLTGICLTSIYPAMWLTSIPTTSATKKHLGGADSGKLLRQILSTLQLSISVALMVVTVIMHEQMSYTRNKDLGMNIDDVLVIRAPYVGDQQLADLAFERFKQTAVSNPAIRNASMSVSVPGERFGIGNRGGIRKEGSGTEENNYFRTGRIDPNFADVYELRFLAGSNFSYHYGKEDDLIINREAARVLGFADPNEASGKRLRWNDRMFTIIGVTENFHQESFHRTVEPIVLYHDAFDQNIRYISLKLTGRGVNTTLASVQAAYKAAFPGQPYDCFFLDDHFNKQYQSDKKTGEIISACAFLAVLIAGLGLFGLMSYVAAKRTKEIGIRKILGASTQGIVKLLCSEFVLLVVIANILAWPVAYYLASKWLQNFAYRIDPQWWTFILSGGLALLIALLTAGWHAIRAATANPVEALRYE